MNKYTLRRRILDIIANYSPAPLNIDSIASEPFICASGATRESVAEELRGLALNGYVENLFPGREPGYVITKAGNNQRKRECDLDEYVWGEQASKFQR